MKKILNTLYVTSPDCYLSLDGENIVILEGEAEKGRIPLHNLEAVVCFGYKGVSPALMGGCASRNIALCFLTPQGKFLARVTGGVHGNVILRKKQYEVSGNPGVCISIARNCIIGKVYNGRWILERALRDHSIQIDTDRVKQASLLLKRALGALRNVRIWLFCEAWRVRLPVCILVCLMR